MVLLHNRLYINFDFHIFDDTYKLHDYCLVVIKVNNLMIACYLSYSLVT